MMRDCLSEGFCISCGFLKKVVLCAKNIISSQETKIKYGNNSTNKTKINNLLNLFALINNCTPNFMNMKKITIEQGKDRIIRRHFQPSEDIDQRTYH